MSNQSTVQDRLMAFLAGHAGPKDICRSCGENWQGAPCLKCGGHSPDTGGADPAATARFLRREEAMPRTPVRKRLSS